MTLNRQLTQQAYRLFQNAVQRGDIERPSVCSHCGGNEPHRTSNRTIHGHHEDYAKPLAIMWLCGRCHESLHYEADSPVRTAQPPIAIYTLASKEPRLTGVPTDQQREAFKGWIQLLKLWDGGHSVADIARMRGVSWPSAQRHIQRALAAREKGWV